MKRAYIGPQVSSRPREKCLVDGCDRLEELASGRSAGGLCAGHRKRKQLQAKGLLTVPFESPLHDRMGLQADGSRRLSPRQALVQAAMDMADADTSSESDTAWRRGIERLVHAAIRYAEARNESERRHRR